MSENIDSSGDVSSRSGRSGLAFEITVAPGSPAHTPRRIANAMNASMNNSTSRGTSEDQIIEKLKNAEQRRLSIEGSKKEQIRAKHNLHVKRVADQLNKLSLELETHKQIVITKLEKSAERRGSLIQQRKEKLSKHLDLLKDVQNKLEEARSACRQRVQGRVVEKLSSSDAHRNALLAARREKAAAHSAHAEAVRAAKKAMNASGANSSFSGLNDSYSRNTTANDTALSLSCCASPSPSNASICGCAGEQIVSPCAARLSKTTSQ